MVDSRMEARRSAWAHLRAELRAIGRTPRVTAEAEAALVGAPFVEAVDWKRVRSLAEARRRVKSVLEAAAGELLRNRLARHLGTALASAGLEPEPPPDEAARASAPSLSPYATQIAEETRDVIDAWLDKRSTVMWGLSGLGVAWAVLGAHVFGSMLVTISGLVATALVQLSEIGLHHRRNMGLLGTTEPEARTLIGFALSQRPSRSTAALATFEAIEVDPATRRALQEVWERPRGQERFDEKLEAFVDLALRASPYRRRPLLPPAERALGLLAVLADDADVPPIDVRLNAVALVTQAIQDLSADPTP